MPALIMIPLVLTFTMLTVTLIIVIFVVPFTYYYIIRGCLWVVRKVCPTPVKKKTNLDFNDTSADEKDKEKPQKKSKSSL